MPRNFSPTPEQRKEKRQQMREEKLQESLDERENMLSYHNGKVHFLDFFHFHLKPDDKISMITIKLDKPLKVAVIVERVTKALEDLL